MLSILAKLDEIETLARRATPGRWQRAGVRQRIKEECIMVGPDGFLVIAIPIGAPVGRINDHAGAFNDAGYVAAVCPSEMLELIAEIRKELL